MRKSLVLIFTALLVVACGGSDGGGSVTQQPDACDINGQKQFVLDAMYDWYLWNDVLPAKSSVNIGAYATPEALLDYLTSFQSLDNFSFINDADADAQFFGEGKYEGFGFSSQLLASDDLRFSRVFSDSPAGAAGFARGDRVLTMNGRTVADIVANEGTGSFFDANDTINFTLRRVDASEYPATVTKDIVTIEPVPQWRVIDAGGGRNVGYMELATFISTANPVFDNVFADFRAANVNDVIIDLRYNGGGLVSTAELLGDYLGGLVAENLTFSRTEFNADRAAANNDEEFFERRGNSMSLSSLVVIATRGTASASELVANSMIPHVNVQIVGDRTFGKPVGQIGLEFCEKILRPTSFKTVNADGDGDYFDGLPLGAGCAAADDLNIPVGDATDPNMIEAMGYLDTGACPIMGGSGAQQKPTSNELYEQVDRRGPPHREFLDAW